MIDAEGFEYIAPTRTFRYRTTFLWIPFWREIEKPRIYYTAKGLASCWVCRSEGTMSGFGRTPEAAWNDWANWALI